jgi:hypothetical protein
MSPGRSKLGEATDALDRENYRDLARATHKKDEAMSVLPGEDSLGRRLPAIQRRLSEEDGSLERKGAPEVAAAAAGAAAGAAGGGGAGGSAAGGAGVEGRLVRMEQKLDNLADAVAALVAAQSASAQPSAEPVAAQSTTRVDDSVE